MTRPNVFARWTRFLAIAAAVLSGAVYAQLQEAGADSDPPDRVGRVSYANGQVSFSPAGSDEWVQAQVNRPVVTGDRLWSDNDSRAELSVDNSTWWLGDQTSVTVSNLDDRIVQMQVHEGTLDVRVRRLPAGNIVEIDTPNLAFSVTRAGRYRVEVDAQDGSTMVVVRDGTGDVYGQSASYAIGAGQAYRFYGSDVSDSEFVALPPIDAFDRFALERDRRYNTVVSARYVSPEVVGYEDLDHYGSWSVESTYGNVWFPQSVNVGWAPYREGHWTWIDPWGWTWVDDEPWGFAPFHYGRWSHFSRGWGWVPGPRSVRPVYAPALVAFVGGAGFSIGVSSAPAIGWFPLAPREVYVPPYRVSRSYFRQVNVSNTVVNVTNITNIYNNPARVAELTYANRGAPNAVTAVPPAAFAQSQNVSRAAIQLPATALQRADVHPFAPVAPARPALLGAGPAARAKPPAAMQRAVVAKAPPPPPPVADAQILQALEKNPGRPLDRAQLQSLRRAAPPAAVAPPAVKVVEQPKPAANAAPPARAAGAGGPRPGRANIPAPGAVHGQAGAAPAPETAAPGATKGPPTDRGAEARRPGTTPPVPGGAAARPPEAKGPAPAAPPANAPAVQRLPVARPPEARGAEPRPAPGQERNASEAAHGAPSAARPPGRPESVPPGPAGLPPGARPPQTEPSPAERAAPSRPPEARSQPPQRAPEARPQPAPEPRVTPQRPPESRPQPAPQRSPEARPQPAPEPRAAPQRPPEARPQPAPEPRAAPQRPPETRPQPAPQRPPEARPEPRAAPQRPPEAQPHPAPQPRAVPQRPPEAQPRSPQAEPRPAPPGSGPPPAKDDNGKGNDRKEPNG